MKKPLHLQGLQVSWRRRRDSNPRHRGTGETVFETAAFNHSATPPHGVGRLGIYADLQKRRYRKGSAGIIWRRDGDSNPRYAFWRIHDFNRAPPASSVISPLAYSLHYIHVFSRALMQRLSILHYLVRTHKRKILIVFAIFRNLQRNVEQRAHHLVGQHLLFSPRQRTTFPL